MRILITMIMILALIPIVSAGSDTSAIDLECQTYGYDFGIAKWEWNDNFDMFLETVSSPSHLMTITGDQSEAFWTATDEVMGVISDEQCFYQVSAGGTGGTVTVHDDSQMIQHITFCGDEVETDDSGDGDGDKGNCKEDCDAKEPVDDVPEFGTLAALAVLAGVGVYIYRKRN